MPSVSSSLQLLRMHSRLVPSGAILKMLMVLSCHILSYVTSYDGNSVLRKSPGYLTMSSKSGQVLYDVWMRDFQAGSIFVQYSGFGDLFSLSDEE